MINLTREAFDKAIARARASAADGDSVWDVLVAQSGVRAHDVADALESWYAIHLLEDTEIARAKAASPVGIEGVVLLESQGQRFLLCVDPWAQQVSRWASIRGGEHVKIFLAKPGQLASVNLQSAVASETGSHRLSASVERPGAAVAFVDAAITRARKEGASDIHFECSRQGLRVKYRLDGVMAEGESQQGVEIAEQIISRIKVMAQLDITERRRPQDGRIRWGGSDHDAIDLRVSIMPSIFGEDAVLRLLDKAQLQTAQNSLSLKHLGFDEAESQRLKELAARPHGMLLMTGPTGSGKTTTVYAALTEVNDGLEKIVTIEDPVEYELPGVLQIPVNEQKGLTFATGLRSILRHDPDKILVGEIRDAETAQIAVQSALTGHLVFTTVHANSMFDVIGRFRHFGIEPFALASALNGVVVQRLLRRLCPVCRSWRELTNSEKKRLAAGGLAFSSRVGVAVGCDHCRRTGFKGRFVVAEIHVLDDEVRDLLIHGAPIAAMKERVYRASTRLLEQALRKAEAGETSIEEIVRVVGYA